MFGLVLQCYAFVAIVWSDEPRQNQGRGLVDHKLVKASGTPPPPSNFIAGHPKATLLFLFFDGFRCGVFFRCGSFGPIAALLFWFLGDFTCGVLRARVSIQ